MTYHLNLRELHVLFDKHTGGNKNNIQNFIFECIDGKDIKVKTGDILKFQTVGHEVNMLIEIQEKGFQIIEINEIDIRNKEITSDLSISKLYNWLMTSYELLPSIEAFKNTSYGFSEYKEAKTYKKDFDGSDVQYKTGIILSDRYLRFLNFSTDFEEVENMNNPPYNAVDSVDLKDLLDVDLDILNNTCSLNIYTKRGLYISEGTCTSFKELSNLKSILKQYLKINKLK